jgi:hypothetical protein
MANIPVLNTNYQDNNNLRSWPLDATEALIRHRCHYHDQFIETRIQNQGTLWWYISNHIYNNHNLNVMPTQCRTKWNTLVAGYENLKQLLSDNPEGYQTYTLSFYDRQFHNELSDEFWYNMGNYLINLFFI